MVSHSSYTTELNVFDDLDLSSRIWVFQSARSLVEKEHFFIDRYLEQFLSQWTSHNRSLIARGAVLYNHFVVIALDEGASSDASGCSIDAMTNQIKFLSYKLGVDLLNRDIFYFVLDDEISGIPMNQLQEAKDDNKIDESTLVFNNLVNDLSALRNEWIVPVGKSWHKRFL